MEPVGTWNQLTSLNLTRVNAVSDYFMPVNVMANKTFIVTTVEAPPYTMLTEEIKKMTGNDRFEGIYYSKRIPIIGILLLIRSNT